MEMLNGEHILIENGDMEDIEADVVSGGDCANDAADEYGGTGSDIYIAESHFETGDDEDGRTQFIDTDDGQVQLVQIRLPDTNELAWVNIVTGDWRDSSLDNPAGDNYNSKKKHKCEYF